MSKIASKFAALLVLLSMILSCAPASFAQNQVTGGVQGRVYDIGTPDPPQGVGKVAVASQPPVKKPPLEPHQGIGEATVLAINQETGIKRTVLTREDGSYFIPYLPSGTYTLTATATGYKDIPNSPLSKLVDFPIHIVSPSIVDLPPIALQKIDAPPVVPPATGSTAAATATTGATTEQLVNTTNATRGGYFGSRELLALPLPGIRSFDSLAFLLPGVAPPPQAIGKTIGPGIGPGVGTSGQFSVNGLRSRSNNFTIDGSDNNEEEVGVRRQGFTALVPQSIESVQEFHISTLLPDSQYGRNMGAQVDVASRSGVRDYHGTLYGFLTDKRLKARDPFDLTGGPANFPITRASDGAPVQLDGSPLAPANPVGGKDPYTRGQYGFVVGGPLVKQKSFYFASFEHQDINASRESHFAVPTVAERGLFQTGDRGLRDLSGNPGFATTAVGDAFFSLFPFPNDPLGPYGPNTYTEILPASADGTIFSIKLDQNFKAFGKDHTLTERYNFTDDNTILPVTGEALFSTLRARTRTQNLSIILNSVVSSRMANLARFSYGRTSLNFNEVRDPFLLPSGTTLDVTKSDFANGVLIPASLKNPTPFLLNAPIISNQTLAGRPPQLFTQCESGTFFVSVPCDSTHTTPFGTELATGHLGQVIVSGYSPIGVDVFNFPQGRSNNTFQYAYTLVYDLGKQRLTAGFDIRRSQLNSFLDKNFRPLAVFSAAKDIFGQHIVRHQKRGQIGGDGVDFYLGRDFAAVGAPTGLFQTQALVPDSHIGLRFWENDFFLSDQIRASSTLTLTFGLRYELNTVPTDVNHRIESTFDDPETQKLPELVGFLAGRDKIYNGDHNNFAPYIAFAWDPEGKGRTSIRGGYGIYYDQILGAVVSQSRNVFPSFSTFNLAGLVTPDGDFNFVNPSDLAVPGTLNTFNRGFLNSLLGAGSPADVILALNQISGNAAGAAFVLPAANLVTPYSQHWAFTVEREVKRDFLVSAAYVGTRGVHLLGFATPNLGPNSIPKVTGINFDDGGSPRFQGTVKPPSSNGGVSFGRPFPSLGAFTSIESDANSIYHALQLQAIKRFSHGFQFTTAYTWSHAIDEASDIFDLAGARALPQDSFDRRAERGDANFDVRHRFVYSFIWDLPTFKQNKILGGWQLSSIGAFQTGQPYTVLFCCDVNLDGNLTDRITPQGTLRGSAPRNSFRAPGINNIDAALNKTFRFSERQNLEFRTEVFNLFNHPNFGVPIHQLFFANLTTQALTNKIFVNTVLPMRTIQFALKYNF
jgi:hypothetical protein